MCLGPVFSHKEGAPIESGDSTEGSEVSMDLDV